MKRNELEKIVPAAIALGALIALMVYFVEPWNGIDGSLVTIVALMASVYAAISSIYLSRTLQRKNKLRRVFIIHAMEDSGEAQKLASGLKALGYIPWVDVEDITPGQRIEEAIKNGLSESSAAILIVSSNLDCDSRWVTQQLKAALSTMSSKDKFSSPVIPVRLDDSSLPNVLSGIHAVDLRDEKSLESLDKGLRRIIGA